MNLKIKAILFFALMLIFSTGQASAAQVDNGGFDSGLSGWNVETSGVTWDASFGAAKLKILDYDQNVTMITLSQNLTISSQAAIEFDVRFDNVSERILPVDPGIKNYFQASYIPGDPNLPQQTLMNYDVDGPYDINLNPLAGSISEEGWFHFTGIITGSGTLYFDLQDLGDPYYSITWIDNVVITEGIIPVPEPSAVLLLCAGIAWITSIGRKKV